MAAGISLLAETAMHRAGGAADTSDAMIHRLKAVEQGDIGDLVAYFAERLDGTDEAVRAFLARLEILDGLPPRDCIHAVNLNLLGKVAPGLTRAEIEAR